jgi:hypothetical protein
VTKHFTVAHFFKLPPQPMHQASQLAQETSTKTSLWPQVCFFFLKYHIVLLMTFLLVGTIYNDDGTIPLPPPPPHPLPPQPMHQTPQTA